MLLLRCYLQEVSEMSLLIRKYRHILFQLVSSKDGCQFLPRLILRMYTVALTGRPRSPQEDLTLLPQ